MKIVKKLFSTEIEISIDELTKLSHDHNTGLGLLFSSFINNIVRLLGK